MAYDRADWHYGGEYPEDLPPENGGTHIGMFLAWAINNGLEGEVHKNELKASADAVRARKITGREFLNKECDEKFGEYDLNEEGNAFAKFYYESDRYFADYDACLGATLPSLYHVRDSWENYDKIAAVIDKRYNAWKASRR